MTTEGEALQRRFSAAVRDTVSAYRIQTSAGPATDKALEEILFRGAHEIVNSLVTYPGPQRVALLPNVVWLMLAAFLEELDAGRYLEQGYVEVENCGEVAAGTLCVTNAEKRQAEAIEKGPAARPHVDALATCARYRRPSPRGSMGAGEGLRLAP